MDLFRNRDAIEKFGTFLEMSICLNQFMLRKIVINRENWKKSDIFTRAFIWVHIRSGKL